MKYFITLIVFLSFSVQAQLAPQAATQKILYDPTQQYFCLRFKNHPEIARVIHRWVVLYNYNIYAANTKNTIFNIPYVNGVNHFKMRYCGQTGGMRTWCDPGNNQWSANISGIAPNVLLELTNTVSGSHLHFNANSCSK